MTSTSSDRPTIIAGGQLLADREFPATTTGYTQMLTWIRGHGHLQAVGVEGTGSYGAGLARHLHTKNITVLEVPRSDRRLRRQRGKSDPIDAESAARTVLAGNASGAPKHGDGSDPRPARHPHRGPQGKDRSHQHPADHCADRTRPAPRAATPPQ